MGGQVAAHFAVKKEELRSQELQNGSAGFTLQLVGSDHLQHPRILPHQHVYPPSTTRLLPVK
jgi:hypothetical protein